MESEFEKKLKNVRPKPLSSDEREYMWSRVEQGIAHVPAWKKMLNTLGVHDATWWKKFVVTPLLILGLLFGSASTTFAFADGSKPGDFLFPADIAAEKIMLTLAFGAAEDELRVEFAQERLEEVKELLALAESFTFTSGNTTVTGTNTTPPAEATAQSSSEDDGTNDDTGNDDGDTAADETDDAVDDDTDSTTNSSDTATTNEDDDTTDESDNTTENESQDDVEQEYSDNVSPATVTDPSRAAVINDALLYALAQLEESKELFESEGNAVGFLAIEAFIVELEGMAENHVGALDRIAISVHTDDAESKVKISASSDELKTKFNFTSHTDDDGEMKQRYSLTDEDTVTKLSIKSDEDDDELKLSFTQEDIDEDDYEDAKKMTICHKGKTLLISKSSWWAHEKQGDTKGACSDNDGDKDSDVWMITLHADQDNEKVWWKTDGKSYKGFKIVWSKNDEPTYPTRSGDKYAYLGDEHADHFKLNAFDGDGDYYVRVCEYIDGACGIYSNQVKIELGDGSDSNDDGDVTAITLHADQDNEKVWWKTDGETEKGFKVVWSKNENPTYPKRSGDEYAYLDDDDADHHKLSAFDGAGTYYVRVCEYLGGDCGVYSNQVQIELGEDTSDTTPPTISNLSVEVGTSTAVLTWTTDEKAYKWLWYEDAPNSTYQNVDIEDGNKTKDHRIELDGLMPDTTYYYVIKVKDVEGNKRYTDEAPFTTDALSVETDEDAPIISNVSVGSLTQTSADVTWETDEAATSKVYMSATSPVDMAGATIVMDVTPKTSHGISFSILSASTTYYYIVESTDAVGNTATTSEDEFTTEPEPEPADEIAPEIATLNVDASTTEALLTWTTNEGAESVVWISETSPVDTSVAGTEQNGFVTNHERTLTGLTAETTYYYIVAVTDEAGNVTTTSEDSFETEAEPAPADTTAPVISNVAATMTGSTSAQVTWTTNEDAMSTIYYSVTSPVDTGSADTMTSAILSTSHTFDLLGLTASSTYYFIVESADGLGNTAAGAEDSFTID